MIIVITGAESSGKTTLATGLADHFGHSFTEEYARDYLLSRSGIYNYSDLLIIAKGQYESIKQNSRPEMHIIDTDLLTIKIWAEYKYGKCDPWIVKTLEDTKPDIYLLCAPDISWEKDILRENPNDREELFRIYKQEIESLSVPYVEVSGSRLERLETSVQAIEKLKIQDS